MTEKRLLEIKAQFSAQGWLGFKEAKELFAVAKAAVKPEKICPECGKTGVPKTPKGSKKSFLFHAACRRIRIERQNKIHRRAYVARQYGSIKKLAPIW